MHRFKFGGANTPGIYLDETVMRMCYTHRRLFVKLASHLAAQGDKKRAEEVLDRAEKEFPAANVPHDFQSSSIEMAQVYASIGNKVKATEILEQLWKKSEQSLIFNFSLDHNKFKSTESNCQLQLFYVMRHLINIADMIDEKMGNEYESKMTILAQQYMAKGGALPKY
jgi:hypothetical protein